MLGDSSGFADQQGLTRTVALGTVIRDRFVLEEELDYGRLGVVYRAADRQRSGVDGRQHRVALLILPAEVARSKHVLELFKRDFVQVQSLTHPNIVKVFDFDRDGDLYFVTMELLDGESLRCVVDSLRPESLWEEEAFAVIRAIGDALAYAHARGVVHGDVRLENVLVTAAHEVKVLFTSACLMKSAPFSVDSRDDVHGLACAAYELLTGESPFIGRRSLSVRQRGIEPKRIKTLSRRQWKTLRGALAGRDERGSVSRFLADFADVDAKPRLSKANTTRRSMGWRFVATAWFVVAVGAAYVLSHDGSQELPQILVAEAELEHRKTDTEVQPTPLIQQPSVSNLDGRVSAADTAAMLEPLAASSNRSVEQDRSPQAADASLATVSFAERAVTTSESEGVVTLKILRTGGTGTTSVVWWTSEGTAQEDDDYASFGHVVETFNSGEESRSIFIPVTSDRMLEGREFFRVYLRENPAGSARLGEITQTTVTLVDDDY